MDTFLFFRQCKTLEHSTNPETSLKRLMARHVGCFTLCQLSKGGWQMNKNLSGVGFVFLVVLLTPAVAGAAMDCEYLPVGIGCKVESCDLPAAGATQTTCEYFCYSKLYGKSSAHSCIQSVVPGRISRLPVKNRASALLGSGNIRIAAASGAVGDMPDHTGYTRCSIKEGGAAPAPGARCRDCDHDGVFHWVRSGCGCSLGKVVCDQARDYPQSYDEPADKWVFDFSR